MHWMFLPFKQYAQFRGRSQRKEFWLFVLFVSLVLVVIVGSFIAYAAAAEAWGQPEADWPLMGPGEGWLLLMLVLVFLLGFVVLIPTLALCVRRLHDLDRSGWWILGPVVALLVGPTGTGTIADLVLGLSSTGVLLMLLVFCCRRGTHGPNRYGPDPRQVAW